ncbi:hypothetical protein QFL00_13030 [Enterococcus faecalis]|uniref:hypothetical protein n=1 Tax=Enterococcus faecalis TaxID=1351 RepID=UPI002457ADB3|nr:hypothetical protein [Enterococcus faecalis]MDH5042167.1 hypothetical protein [Enterococcus faecalis]
MPYLVKISAYLGKDGWPVANLKDAVLFDHKETAAIATIVSGGTVSEVKEAIIMPEKSKKHIGKAIKRGAKKEQTEKATKSNQAWMKGAK